MAGQSKKPSKEWRDERQRANTPASSPTVGKTKPEEVFYLAVCYRFSAQLLIDKVGKIFGPAAGAGLIQDQLPPTSVPGVILECLAIEVYLKCLLQLESGSASAPRGHKLADLFAMVSQKRQDRIKQIYDSLLVAWKEEKAGQAINSDDPFTWEFDRVLPTIDETFIKLRYAYEYSMGFTAFNTRIALSLQRVILEIRPDWEQYIQFRVSTTSLGS